MHVEHDGSRDVILKEQARKLRMSGRRLTMDDVRRAVDAWVPETLATKNGRTVAGFEWVTWTDGGVKVDVRYLDEDGRLTVTAFEPKNALLYDKVVQTRVEFIRALRTADTAHRRLVAKLSKPHPPLRRRRK